MRTGTKKNIFISYRVNDTAGVTGRLADTLKQHFYDDQIFMDIDKLEPGVDFVDVISKSLESCDVMLAVVGNNWIGKREGRKPRIQDDNDWVRLELSTALQRGIRVVPLLVEGATLPETEELPADLQTLLRRQTHEISNKRWRYDTEQLALFLEQSVGIPRKPKPGGEFHPQRASKPFWSAPATWVIGGIGVVAFLVILFSTLSNNKTVNSNNNNVRTDTNAAIKITEPETVVSPGQQPGEQTTQPPIVEEPVVNYASVQGVWVDQAGNYIVIAQDEDRVNVESYTSVGAVEGTGSGLIKGRNLSLNVNTTLLGWVTVEAMVSGDEASMTGQTTYKSANGPVTIPFYFVRQAL